MEKIDNPRAQIDAIDGELLRLLNERLSIALKVGAVKQNNDASFCDHNREREVLTRLCRENKGPLNEQSVTSIFQRIIDECLNAQQNAFSAAAATKAIDAAGKSNEAEISYIKENGRIAFLGERGTFSEEAAGRLSGENSEKISCPTFESLFAAIDEGKADYILAPLENSLAGSVHRCYDLLLESSLAIVSEIILPISHFLIGCEGASLDSIETIESHPVALAQCGRFFALHPRLKRIATDDTASSVRRVIESGDKSRAAIAGRRAANIYGGVILQEHLEDHTENYTRFVLLAQNPVLSEKGNKISLLIKLAHRPGALHDALRPFVRRGIDLLKIESRPTKQNPRSYNFYLDIQAPARETELRGALDEISQQAESVRFLGRYSTIEIPKDR